MAQQKKAAPAPKSGVGPVTVQSRGDRQIIRGSKTSKNSQVLRGLLDSAASADEGSGSDMTNMTHEERMRALFG